MAFVRRALWCLALLCLPFGSVSPAATIALSCSALGKEFELCRQGAEAWAKRSGHRVRFVSTPNASSEQLALYQQLLAAHAADIDVLQIDVVWPGILANHLLDLRAAAGDLVQQHFPHIIANNTVGGKLVAMPWFADVPLLFYRADLLRKHGRPVPDTWQELTETAQTIQQAERAAGNTRMWGYIWQGRAYEGLTCNALEWISSFGGGLVVERHGRISIDNPKAVQALQLAADWVGRISPTGVLNYAEEETRGVFQSGHAIFMRNWPYAWALLNAEGSPVRGRVSAAAMPAGQDRRASTLGGQQLAVSRYSAHPEIAADLVLYLTGRYEQKRRALLGGYFPTVRDLYRDPEVQRANPLHDVFLASLESSIARPSAQTGRRYNRVSTAFWNAAHGVLSRQVEAQPALDSLERHLMRTSRGEQW
jgi:trehalose/maltose transport system substrate-binding protein